MNEPTWVFGYGSLVSPSSVEATIGRAVDLVAGYEAAVLNGFERRWNYGSLRQRATWTIDGRRVEAGVVVSLGLAPSNASTNGAVVRVDDDELAHLDRRESDYDRVEVTDLVETVVRVRGAVFTYVPRPSAIERYERARAERTAAVRAGYVELVEGAFADLEPGALDRYRRTTPAPEVPVVAVDAVWLAE